MGELVNIGRLRNFQALVHMHDKVALVQTDLRNGRSSKALRLNRNVYCNFGF